MIKYFKVKSVLEDCDVMDPIYRVEGSNDDLFVRISLMPDVTEVDEEIYYHYLADCAHLRGPKGPRGNEGMELEEI